MKYDFDSILTRLRSGVQGTVSTLEGTFAGDLLQSVAAELARIWSQEVDTAAQRGFLATAEGQWLDAVCGDYGITRKSGESDEGLRAGPWRWKGWRRPAPSPWREGRGR